MKKITVANYRQDPYYARIVKAVEGLLREKGFVAPLELFIRMDLLSPESVENWRRGRIAYLERVIRCNLVPIYINADRFWQQISTCNRAAELGDDVEVFELES